MNFSAIALGNGKPGRIGVMDTSKLIELETLSKFRYRYGKAIAIFNKQVTIRDSIFVELTGHQLN